MPLRRHAQWLEDLYARYHSRAYLSPDPLEIVRRYGDDADREVAGLVASCLAYGRVAQINRNVEAVLSRLGPHPARRLVEMEPADLREQMRGLRHRFAGDVQIAGLLTSARFWLTNAGPLGGRLGFWLKKSSDTRQALSGFVDDLTGAAGVDLGHLLPDPRRGSACKRLWLYLRWMVRCDDLDLGCWKQIGPQVLIVPLDTHMHRLGLLLGATRRRQADWRTAAEITAAFARLRPDDPVRYDFVLTRLGIHPQLRHLALPGVE